MGVGKVILDLDIIMVMLCVFREWKNIYKVISEIDSEYLIWYLVKLFFNYKDNK